MHDGRGICGDANPFPRLEKPRIYELFAPRIGFPVLHAFHPHDPGSDRYGPEHVHVHRFGRHLLLRRVGRMNAGQEVRLALHAAVVVDENDGIVKQLVESLRVAGLLGLVPCFFEGDNLRLVGGFGRVLSRGGNPVHNKKDEREENGLHGGSLVRAGEGASLTRALLLFERFRVSNEKAALRPQPDRVAGLAGAGALSGRGGAWICCIPRPPASAAST